jgi:hypothetical protein
MRSIISAQHAYAIKKVYAQGEVYSRNRSLSLVRTELRTEGEVRPTNRGDVIMMGNRSRFSFAGGLTSLALALVAQQARGDVILLEDLLNGASIRAGGLLYENFRGYGPATIFGVTSLADSSSSILVTSTNLGLAFTGLDGGPLLAHRGQGPFGESFTFDVVPLVPANNIGLAAIEASGSLEPFLFGVGSIAPLYSASLSVLEAAPPLNVNVFQENRGMTTIASDVSALATFPEASSLTVTESFVATGLTFHGSNTFAEIGSVTVSFVPEPSPLVLVGVLGVSAVSFAWLRRRMGIA